MKPKVRKSLNFEIDSIYSAFVGDADSKSFLSGDLRSSQLQNIEFYQQNQKDIEYIEVNIEMSEE